MDSSESKLRGYSYLEGWIGSRPVLIQYYMAKMSLPSTGWLGRVRVSAKLWLKTFWASKPL